MNNGLMTITFKPISVKEAFTSPNFAELATEYRNESGNPYLPQKPNREHYENLERSGALFGLGAFDNSELVGFGAFLLINLPHHSELLASFESLFLAKEYRKGTAGLRLIRALRDYAKEKGAVGVYYGCRAGSRLERLFDRLPNVERMDVVFYEALK